MTQFKRKEIEALVLAAAKKLNKQIEVQNDKNAFNDALNYFEQNSKPEHSNIDLANIALLGVMSVYIAGAVQPIVRYDWGDLTAAPKLNPFTNPSGGGAVIGQANRLDYVYDDSLGTKANSIARLINGGEFSPEFIEYLQQNGFEVGDPNKFSPFKTQPKPD